MEPLRLNPSQARFRIVGMTALAVTATACASTLANLNEGGAHIDGREACSTSDQTLLNEGGLECVEVTVDVSDFDLKTSKGLAEAEKTLRQIAHIACRMMGREPSKEFGFEQIQDAHAYMEVGQQFGKIIVEVRPDS